MKRKSIFKNDPYPFNIKFKWFDLKLKLLNRKSINLHIKFLRKLLIHINDIGYPSNEDEINLLKHCLDLYHDELLMINEEFLKHKREYVKEK